MRTPAAFPGKHNRRLSVWTAACCYLCESGALIAILQSQPGPGLCAEVHKLRVIVEKPQLLLPHRIPFGVLPQHKIGEALGDVLNRIGGGVVGDEVVLMAEEEVKRVGGGQAVVQVIGPERLVKVIQVGAGRSGSNSGSTHGVPWR